MIPNILFLLYVLSLFLNYFESGRFSFIYNLLVLEPQSGKSWFGHLEFTSFSYLSSNFNSGRDINVEI